MQPGCSAMAGCRMRSSAPDCRLRARSWNPGAGVAGRSDLVSADAKVLPLHADVRRMAVDVDRGPVGPGGSGEAQVHMEPAPDVIGRVAEMPGELACENPVPVERHAARVHPASATERDSHGRQSKDGTRTRDAPVRCRRRGDRPRRGRLQRRLAARGARPRRARASSSSSPGTRSAARPAGTRLFRVACLEHPGLTPIARRARDLWRELETSSGQALFHETGGLMIGPPDSRIIAGTLRAADAHDLPVERLDTDEIARRFPAHAREPG